MGKGDKKTKRGKIILGSYGVRRPRKKTGLAAIEASKNTKAITKKIAAKEKSPVKEQKPVKVKVEKVTEKAEKVVKTPKEAKPKKEKKAE